MKERRFIVVVPKELQLTTAWGKRDVFTRLPFRARQGVVNYWITGVDQTTPGDKKRVQLTVEYE